MLHGRTIRSTIPRGRISGVRLDFDTAGFTVVDHRDIPGRNVVALIDDDQPCLAEREVRHVAEPILLLAHEDREAPASARRSTLDEYAEHADLRSRASPTVVQEHRHRERATSTPGSPRADVIVEGTYRTGHQEHVYIEPNGVIAVPEDGGDDGLRLDAVPLLRPQGAARRCWAMPRRARARRPDRDRRRLRRQGGVSRR